MFCAQQDKLRPSEEKNHGCYMSLFLLDILTLSIFSITTIMLRSKRHLARAVLWIVWSEKKEGEKGKEEKLQPVFETQHVPDRSQ